MNAVRLGLVPVVIRHLYYPVLTEMQPYSPWTFFFFLATHLREKDPISNYIQSK